MRFLLLDLVLGPIDCVKIWWWSVQRFGMCICGADPGTFKKILKVKKKKVAARVCHSLILPLVIPSIYSLTAAAILMFCRNCVCCQRLWPLRSALVNLEVMRLVNQEKVIPIWNILFNQNQVNKLRLLLHHIRTIVESHKFDHEISSFWT